jgi:hypothetical protein
VPGGAAGGAPSIEQIAQFADAVASIAKDEPGMDGISYPRDMLAAGIKTPLTDDFAKDILGQNGTESLGDDTLRKLLPSAMPD